MKRYTVRFVFVFCCFLACFSGFASGQSQDLVPLPNPDSQGPGQWLRMAGITMYITQHIRTADGIILSAADVRCIPPQAQLFVPRSQVEAGATPENIAGYQAFIAEEVTLLGPAGTAVDCGDRGNKYLPQAVVTRQQQKTNDLRDQVDVAEKKLSDAKTRHTTELGALNDTNAELEQQASKWFWWFVAACIVAFALGLCFAVYSQKKRASQAKLNRQIFERDQQKQFDDAEIERLKQILIDHKIESSDL